MVTGSNACVSDKKVGMGLATTRSSGRVPSALGSLLSRTAFPLSSLRVLSWAMHKQASEILLQTSSLPIPSQFDGQALSKVIAFIIQMCYHGGRFCVSNCVAMSTEVGCVNNHYPEGR